MKRRRLTKLDEAALLGDNERYAKILRQRTRCIRTLCEKTLPRWAQEAATRTSSPANPINVKWASLLEQAELILQSGVLDEQEKLAEDILAGKAGIPGGGSES